MSASNVVKALSHLKLGHVGCVQGAKIIASNPRSINSISSYGCSGCIFRTDKGAKECKFKDACMAHKRPDGKSVIFKHFNK